MFSIAVLVWLSLAGFIISIFEFGSNCKTNFFKFSEQDDFAAFIKNSLFFGSFPSTISIFKLAIKKDFQTYYVDT